MLCRSHCFGVKQAESIDKYLKKSSPIFLEGRLKLEQWVDKNTQQKKSRIIVVAEMVKFLPSSRSNNDTYEEKRLL